MYKTKSKHCFSLRFAKRETNKQPDIALQPSAVPWWNMIEQIRPAGTRRRFDVEMQSRWRLTKYRRRFDVTFTPNYRRRI
jgi:hypothetical protein